MRRVATNLYIDDRGKYHARVRVQIDVGRGGKKKPVLRRKSMAAENLADAKAKLAQFEADLRAPQIACSQAKSPIPSASDSGVVAALQQTISILEGRIGSLASLSVLLGQALSGRAIVGLHDNRLEERHGNGPSTTK